MPEFSAGLGWLIFAVLALVVTVFIVFATIARYYKKISPNVAAVVTGRSHKVKVVVNGQEQVVERGYRYVVGGGFFLYPIVEKMQEMNLNVMAVPVSVTNVPDKDGALVTVEAVANVKILSTDDMLPLAVERFLGKTEAEIIGVIKQTLEGNLRAIVGTMEVVGLLRDRQTFQQNVLAEAGTDLGKLGLGVDVLKIQNINDTRGYIESLGKKKTAEIVRDAAVGEAEAKRETDIQSAAARQAGETAKAKAEEEISNANRQRDMTIADNEAQVKARQAIIPIAGQIAAAERTAELNTKTVDADKAKTVAEKELQGAIKEKREAELNATTILDANKAREALIIKSEGDKQAAELEGEASRIKQEKEGQGQQAHDTGVAEGRKKLAEATQREREANAAGEQTELLAKAKGKEADLLATAAGTRAQLLAEAEGIEKKAEAYAKLDAAGRFLLILQELPKVIEAAGYAGERVLKPVAEAIGEGIGNVKDIRIIDMGGAGAGKDGGNVVGQFFKLPVETIFGLVQKLEASGMMPFAKATAKRFGIDIDELLKQVKAAPAGEQPATGTDLVPGATPGTAAPAADSVKS